ncbi:MAG: methyltransferase domain-containing protein, partial [Deltaproteobacteria bacterium]|nr:methyltransferase domain-containing protein [Deltaproteobacteria bacterium]
MEPFRYHIYICTQKKPESAPSCLETGAEEVFKVLNRELAAAGLTDNVQVTTCGCLGICGKGPNMVVYPDGIWYTGLTPKRVSKIVKDHIGNNTPVEDFLLKDAETLKKEIIAHDQMVLTMKTIMEKAGVIPEELNQFMRGFMESRIFLTAIELDLFTAIGSGAAAPEIAKKIKTDPRATEALLNALAAIDVLDKNENSFRNKPLTARYLVKDSEHDSRIAAMHIVGLWHRWSTLTECLKKGTSVIAEKGKTRDEDETRAFIAAMHKNAVFRAEKTAEILDLGSINSMLDLGGGSGAYAIAFTKYKPDIKATVFDLPAVISLTKKYVSEEGLENKIDFIEGDMIKDPFGTSYDLVWISAICHMFSPDENLKLFKKVYEALNPGGRIIVQDFILNEDKTSP